MQAQRAAVLAEMTLVQTLQLDPMQDYQFEIPELDAVGTEFTALGVEEATNRALSQRADYQAAQTLLQASEQSVRVARASYRPTISLSANYSSNFSNTDPCAFFDQIDNRRGGSLGLSFSIPIFDRLNARNATERARVQVDNSRINLESLRQNVAVQVRTGLLDLRSAEEQLVVAEALRRSASGIGESHDPASCALHSPRGVKCVGASHADRSDRADCLYAKLCLFGALNRQCDLGEFYEPEKFH